MDSVKGKLKAIEWLDDWTDEASRDDLVRALFGMLDCLPFSDAEQETFLRRVFFDDLRRSGFFCRERETK